MNIGLVYNRFSYYINIKLIKNKPNTIKFSIRNHLYIVNSYILLIFNLKK